MVLLFKSKLRYFVLALIATVSVIHAYDFKLYTNENFNKRIETEHFRVYYNQKDWQLANWFASKADGWAEDVHEARGFKPGIKVDVYLLTTTMIENAFSSYDKIYMFTNRGVNFTQPEQDEWFEDTFKHEYGHSTVSLGAYNPFLVYSGIDQFVKYNINSLDGFLQEGSSVLLESTHALTPGRLNSAPFVNEMLYNVDKGYKVDFWKTNNYSVGGNRYNEGAMFFKFIFDAYGEDKWRNAFNNYLNSYWNLIAYRYPEFLAKELGVDFNDLMRQYTSWLEQKSIEATPVNIVQGKPLSGQTSVANYLLDIDDSNLYFAASADNMLKIAAVPTKPNDMGLHKQSTKITYSQGNAVGSNSVIDLNEIKQNGAEGFTVYHRVATNRSVLGDGLDSYYIKTTEKNKGLGNNLGNYFIDDSTKNAVSMVKVENRFFTVTTNHMGQYQLHDPLNNEVIFAYNQNFVIDRPRYNKERNIIYFAANKVGDTKAYVFAYNLATKQVSTLVQGMSPFINKNDLFFVNLTGEDKALNAYKLNLNNNQVVKLTNLKYGLFEVLANDDGLFYTSFNNRGSAESYRTSKAGIYVLEQDKWLNEPHNELITAARNYNINATNDSVPTPQMVDNGKTVFPFALKLQPVNLMYTLDGNFLVQFRNQQDTIKAQVGFVGKDGVWENPQNFTNENGDYLGGSVEDRLETVKNRFKDRYKLKNKDLYFNLFYSPKESSRNSRKAKYDFFRAGLYYKDKKEIFSFGDESDVKTVGYDKDKINYFFVFGPRLWGFSYGLIPTIDLSAVYEFNGRKKEIVTTGSIAAYNGKDTFYDVKDYVTVTTAFHWNDFKTRLFVGTERTLRYNAYRSSGSKIDKSLSNTANYSLGLELDDVLRHISIVQDFMPIDTSDVDLTLHYTYGNKFSGLDAVGDVQNKYDINYSGRLNPYGTTGNFGIPVNANKDYNEGFFSTRAGYFDRDNQAETLDITLSKIYKFKPYFGDISFGISNIDVVPFITNIYVWTNKRDKETGEKYKGYYGVKDQNLFYGVTSRVALNLWKLDGSVLFSVYQKQNVLSRDGVLDDSNYKGILLNAAIRY